MPVFDGGRRKGNLANARAQFDEDVGKYRQQVLQAFQEVDDNLSDLRILERPNCDEREPYETQTAMTQPPLQSNLYSSWRRN